MILPMPYKPHGAWWLRLWDAVITALCNVKARCSERRERHHEERLEHWKQID